MSEKQDLGSSGAASSAGKEGREYVGVACTLDGGRARVVGRQLSHGRVCALDGTLREIEFSWPTIARVMQAGGKFKS
jgi:hypothetical protein